MSAESNAWELGSQLNSQALFFRAKKRRAACKQLADLNSAQAVPFLISALANEDEELRATAEAGLRGMQEPAALDVVALGYVFTKSRVLRDILEQNGRTAQEAAELQADEPTPAEAVWRTTNTRDGTVLALVPEGQFLAGEAAFPVHLPPYCLAMTAVSNEQYSRFLTHAGPDSHQLGKWVTLAPDGPISSEGGKYATSSEGADLPVLQVTSEGAQAYCEWAGLRLPTELEWEKGARGVDGRQYPWGDEWSHGRPRPRDGDRHGEEIVSVRAFSTARSPYGFWQMMGGVYEWTGDWYEEGAFGRYEQGDLAPPQTGEQRALRGGPWRFGPPSSLRTESRSGTVWRGGTLLTGFRCARDL